MKRNYLALFSSIALGALMPVLCLTSCGGSTEPTDSSSAGTTKEYKNYTDEEWKAENLDTKEIGYQLTGVWALDEYNIEFDFCLNIYKDGAAVVEQRDVYEHESFTYFGYYVQKTTEDGEELNIIFRTEMTDKPEKYGSEFTSHAYKYTLYEEMDGGFAFGFDFGITPGQYMRSVDLAGNSTVTYATFSAFNSKVDKESNEGPSDGGDTSSEAPTEKTVTYTYAQTSGVTINGEERKVGVKASLYDDNTAKIEVGFCMSGMFMFDYGLYSTEEGTWSKTGDVISIVIGEKTYSGDTFEYTVSYTNTDGGTDNVVANAVTLQK